MDNNFKITKEAKVIKFTRVKCLHLKFISNRKGSFNL